MSFTSVSRDKLQKAFALAHKLSENPDVPATHRAQFRAIAYLIWNAHGEPGGPPAGAGAKLAEQFAAAGNPIVEPKPIILTPDNPSVQIRGHGPKP